MRTTGVGGTFNAAAGTFTPAAGATSSSFTYTLVGTSPCINSSSVASVTVNPAATITLIPGSGAASQTVCINTSITTITYQLGNGATGASITSGGLPLGINSSFNAVSGIFTLSGTALSSGTFNFIIGTSGGCPSIPATGTITVTLGSGLIIDIPSADDFPECVYE